MKLSLLFTTRSIHNSEPMHLQKTQMTLHFISMRFHTKNNSTYYLIHQGLNITSPPYLPYAHQYSHQLNFPHHHTHHLLNRASLHQTTLSHNKTRSNSTIQSHHYQS